jgi:hypothetical protein
MRMVGGSGVCDAAMPVLDRLRGDVCWWQLMVLCRAKDRSSLVRAHLPVWPPHFIDTTAVGVKVFAGRIPFFPFPFPAHPI